MAYSFFQRSHPRVIVTSLPEHLSYQKAHLVLKDSWVWENIVGEGDGVLCGGSRHTVEDFAHLDDVGIPWQQFDGHVEMGSLCHCAPARQCWLLLMLKIAVETTD